MQQHYHSESHKTVEREFKTLCGVKFTTMAGAHFCTPAHRFVVVALTLLNLFVMSGSSRAQWHKVLDRRGVEFRTIYFMAPQGTTKIGFAGGTYDTIYRTSDGGNTWDPIWFPTIQPYLITVAMDFTFKDSLTGWMAVLGNQEQVYKTTDGGENWYIPSVEGIGGNGIYYNPFNGGLFVTRWVGIDTPTAGTIVSWDGGSSWNPVPASIGTEGNGFAFNDSLHGINSTCGGPWLRTSDGGANWSPISMGDECWQPLAIEGTRTQFAITDELGTILRTDDDWNNSKQVYQFPPYSGYEDALDSTNCSGTIIGDSCRLFVQLRDACYMSTDQGVSWVSLGGPPALDTQFIYDRRFCISGNKIFAARDGRASMGTLWELDLDSISPMYVGLSERFADGSQQTTLHPGDSVGVTFVPGAGTLAATDSVELNIKYDAGALLLDSLTIPSGWWIADSSSSNGVLTIVLRSDSAESLPDPLLRATFTVDSSDTLGAKYFIYLDSATSFFTPATPCALPILSLGNRDSVEVDIPCPSDTIHVSPTRIVFEDSSSLTAINPGDSVGVALVPGAGTLAATDSVELTLRYDPNATSLSSLTVPPGWWVADSSSSNGILTIVLRSDSAESLPNPLLHAEFKTYLTPSSGMKAFIFLDNAQSFFPQTTPCAPTTLSLASPDSVEIDFTGCGDSTILAAMEGTPPFSIESIVPNPAQTGIRVSGIGSGVSAELVDALGRVVISAALYPLPFTLDVSGLPSGIYFLRFSRNGYVQSRSVSIQH